MCLHNVCTDADAHAYPHVYLRVYAHVSTHVYAHVYAHCCTHVHLYVDTHVYAHVYVHTGQRRGVRFDRFAGEPTITPPQESHNCNILGITTGIPGTTVTLRKLERNRNVALTAQAAGARAKPLSLPLR